MATPAREVRPRQQNYNNTLEWSITTGRRCDLDYNLLPTLILTTTISPTHNNGTTTTPATANRKIEMLQGLVSRPPQKGLNEAHNRSHFSRAIEWSWANSRERAGGDPRFAQCGWRVPSDTMQATLGRMGRIRK